LLASDPKWNEGVVQTETTGLDRKEEKVGLLTQIRVLVNSVEEELRGLLVPEL
jgi:hypothetical protein